MSAKYYWSFKKSDSLRKRIAFKYSSSFITLYVPGLFKTLEIMTFYLCQSFVACVISTSNIPIHLLRLDKYVSLLLPRHLFPSIMPLIIVFSRYCFSYVQKIPSVIWTNFLILFMRSLYDDSLSRTSSLLNVICVMNSLNFSIKPHHCCF